jgi:hypothetical protein
MFMLDKEMAKSAARSQWGGSGLTCFLLQS